MLTVTTFGLWIERLGRSRSCEPGTAGTVGQRKDETMSTSPHTTARRSSSTAVDDVQQSAAASEPAQPVVALRPAPDRPPVWCCWRRWCRRCSACGSIPRIITGVPAWLKPSKFAISTAVYSLTLAWVFMYLRDWPRTRRIVGRTTAAVVLLEVGLIDLQAWRGTTSHFNAGTPLDAVDFLGHGPRHPRADTSRPSPWRSPCGGRRSRIAHSDGRCALA